MAKKKKEEIILTPEEQREADYRKAVRRMEGAEKLLQAQDRVHMYKEAIRMFEALGDYADSEARWKRCKKRLPLARREYREEVYREGMRLKAEAKSAADYEAAIEEFRRLKREYKDIPQQVAECVELKKKARKNEKLKRIAEKLLALAVFVAVVGVVLFLRSPQAYYMEGKFLMSMQDYERANTLFASSAGYKDTDAHVVECNYQRSLLAAENGDYKKAVKLLSSRVGDYKDAPEKKAEYELEVLADAKIGDTITFGKIKWLVADIADSGEKLLIRRSPAKARTVYQRTGRPAEWETSKMRTWLNENFYNSCFSEYERKAVVQTGDVKQKTAVYGTNDRVFLPDAQEAERYAGLLTSKENQKAWWLRTPGASEQLAAFVAADGTVMRYGYAADSKDIAVRPAIWVKGK